MADKKPKYPRFDAAVVNEALSIEDLAGRYGAELVRSPRGFAARCILPGHDDRTPSLQIYTDNNSFHCFGCGRGGDALKFVAIMEGLTEKREFGQVIRLAAQLAGVAPVDEYTEQQLIEARTRAKKRREAHAARLAEERAAKARRAKGWWLRGEILTLDSVQGRYLTGRRGIPFEDLTDPKGRPRLPRAIRAIDQTWRLDRDDPASEATRPALISSLSDAAGNTTAVHLTFIRPDGNGVDKSIGDKGRIVWGDARGRAIRLWRGRTGLSDLEAGRRGVEDDTLAITEGVEDALSVAALYPEWRVWAAYSLGNIAALTLPECVRSVVICAENDESAGAIEQRDKSINAQLAKAGKRSFRVAFPPHGLKDWNAAHERLELEDL